MRRRRRQVTRWRGGSRWRSQPAGMGDTRSVTVIQPNTKGSTAFRRVSKPCALVVVFCVVDSTSPDVAGQASFALLRLRPQLFRLIPATSIWSLIRLSRGSRRRRFSIERARLLDATKCAAELSLDHGAPRPRYRPQHDRQGAAGIKFLEVVCAEPATSSRPSHNARNGTLACRLTRKDPARQPDRITLPPYQARRAVRGRRAAEGPLPCARRHRQPG